MSYSCPEFIDPSLGAALPTLRPLEHGADALRVERLTALVAVTCFLQSGADFTVAQAAGFAFRLPKATRFRHDFRP
jgi:hypothetical protein